MTLPVRSPAALQVVERVTRSTSKITPLLSAQAAMAQGLSMAMR